MGHVLVAGLDDALHAGDEVLDVLHAGR